MPIKLGVVMDPIGSINIKKDSTFAMLLAAQARGWEIHYMEQADLFSRDGVTHARVRGLTLHDNYKHWFDIGTESMRALGTLDVILMRKDPPFNLEYIFTTYLLDGAERDGALIVNKPQSLRDANEKLFLNWFPQCTTATLVSREAGRIKAFLQEHGDIILKPLDGMGGSGIFRVRSDDPNVNVIVETLTHLGTRMAMAQRFLPEIAQGDKRILLVDGEPVPYALARIPAAGETRGNLAAGGTGVGRELSTRDHWICAEVGPELRRRGILFAGLDVIGDYLTEINITSPTCIRELDALYELDIASQLLDSIERQLATRPSRKN